MEVHAPDLVILGNNARPAAAAALRLGWRPWCMDTAFTLDLLALLPNTLHCPTGQYPQGFESFLRTVPERTAWLYTNALDYQASFIGELAALRPLLGNDSNSLITAHAPFELDRVLRAAECRSLELRHFDGERPDYCQWVLHDTRLQRGFGRHIVTGAIPDNVRPRYFRQHIDGRPLAATFVGDGRQCRLAGVTELLIGTPWLHAPALGYAGEVGPITLPEAERAELQHIGVTLTERAGLRGLFTLDGIMAEGRFWLVQLHPCFTESVEVLELATGWRSLVEHGHAFGWHREPTTPASLASQCVARGVLYTSHPMVIPDTIRTFDPDAAPLTAPRWADLPRPGEVVEANAPFMTLFGYGATPAEATAQLQKQAQQAHAQFVGHVFARRPVDWYDLLDDGNV